MATFDFGNGEANYTGEVLQHLLTLTAQENETYKEGLVHVVSGIQKKLALPSIKLGKIVQDHKATPDSSLGEYTHTERYLEPEDFMIYLEFNPRHYEKYYKPFQPTGNLVFRELNPQIQAKMIDLLFKNKAEYINHAIWCSALAADKAKISSADGKVAAGSTEIGGDDDYGPMKYFNGAIARMLINKAAAATTEEAKGGQINVVGTGTFTSGAAVETELYAMWEAVPPKIRKKQNLCVLMDYATWDKYNKYVSGKDYKYSDNTEENKRKFQGKRIIPMVALPADTIIMGVFTGDEDSNLWMGVDYANDENVLQVDKLQNNSELYFFKMLLKMDVNIVRPSEITAHIPFTYTEAASGGSGTPGGGGAGTGTNP